jgi:hypothetical protein
MLWLYESFFPVVWIAFLLYWQIKATDTKTTQRLEPAASRVFRVLTFLIAIVLLSTTRIPLSWLYLPLWPSGFWPFWLGAALTVAGILFAVWAREHLGRFSSSSSSCSGSSSAWRRSGCSPSLGRRMLPMPDRPPPWCPTSSDRLLGCPSGVRLTLRRHFLISFCFGS